MQLSPPHSPLASPSPPPPPLPTHPRPRSSTPPPYARTCFSGTAQLHRWHQAVVRRSSGGRQVAAHEKGHFAASFSPAGARNEAERGAETNGAEKTAASWGHVACTSAVAEGRGAAGGKRGGRWSARDRRPGSPHPTGVGRLSVSAPSTRSPQSPPPPLSAAPAEARSLLAPSRARCRGWRHRLDGPATT